MKGVSISPKEYHGWKMDSKSLRHLLGPWADELVRLTHEEIELLKDEHKDNKK